MKSFRSIITAGLYISHKEDVIWSGIKCQIPLPDKDKGVRRFWLEQWDLNPRNDGVKVRCLTTWLCPNQSIMYNISLITTNGFEPSISVKCTSPLPYHLAKW